MPKANGAKMVNRGGAGLLKKGGGKMTNRGPAGLERKVEPAAAASAVPPPELIKVDRAGAKKNRIECEGEVVLLKHLVPDPANARLHPERNMDAILDSLCLYGQRVPLVIRKQDMMIAAGNGRFEAMQQLGWTCCACSVRNMTDVEFTGFALADNRSAELARWDFEVVSRLERLLAESNQSPVGWSVEEVAALRSQVDPSSAGTEGQSWQELWQGMPEFTQEDQTSWKSIVVHLRNEEDFKAFLKLVGQVPGDVRQNSIWVPKAEITRFVDKRYVSKAKAAPAAAVNGNGKPDAKGKVAAKVEPKSKIKARAKGK
jgi:hypothetical protein